MRHRGCDVENVWMEGQRRRDFMFVDNDDVPAEAFRRPGS